MSEINGVATQDNLVAHMQSTIRALQSALASRATLAAHLGKAFGGDRDYYSVLGYDRTLTPEKYHGRYDRQDIASRIVTAYPDETWRLTPSIYEDDTDIDTVFEKAWKDMGRRLRVFHYFSRADVLACLGRFSLLFLGFNDARTVDQLANPVQGRGERRINYLSVYSERNIDIVELDENIASPTFGMPLIYEIDFNRQNHDNQQGTIRRKSMPKVRVHASRVIHIADDLLEDEIYGKPKLEGVYNLLDDMLKVVGGGAEIFWRSAQRDLIIEVNRDARLSDSDKATLREMTDDYVHGLKRVLGLENATAKTLPIDMASPRDNFDIILDLIAGATGIPKRILIGSERGELASSQDEANWADKNATRQVQYAEPIIVRAFIDRCINFRVLPTPKEGLDGYTVEWQPLITESENEKADRATKYADAVKKYTDGAASMVVPRQEFREVWLGLDPESPYEDDEILDAIESVDDDDEESTESETEDEDESAA